MSQETGVSPERLRAILATVTSVAGDIEKLISASGLAGSFDQTQVEQVTLLFGNLASVAIQAVHEALGREVTPDSVLSLMPVLTPLHQPSA